MLYIHIYSLQTAENRRELSYVIVLVQQLVSKDKPQLILSLFI